MTVTHLINATIGGRCGHEAVIADDDLHIHAMQTIADVDTLLFGAGTYRLLAPHWAEVAREQSGTTAENEFATTLRDKPKILFSSSSEPLEGWNTTLDTSDP